MQIYQSLIDRLRNQHEAIANVVEGLDEKRLAAHPEPEKWSIHDNIAHLAKYQPVFMERINAILNLDEPTFNAYRAEYDPDFETWRRWDTPNLLGKLDSDRREIFDMITGLSSEDLARAGIHKKRGRLSVVDWTELFVLHEAHHMYTIFQLVHNA
ncbi:MAG: DinB family protein [Bacteroidetes bacterium]|nr:DinB family protein [Bacteroidota bacterium]